MEGQNSDERGETGDGARPAQAGDWILDLFAPTFADANRALADRHSILPEARPKLKVVSAYDPQSIQHVYERVHMMIKLDEELKSKKQQTGKIEITEAAQSQTTQHPLTAEGKPEVDLRDSAIWNSEELSVLRGVFRAAKSQLSSLEVKVTQTQRRNEELEQQLAALSAQLDTKTKKLTEATRANHRLKIHVDELQLELRETGMKLGAVTGMWKEMDGEKTRALKESHENRMALDRERLARQQLSLQLQEASQEVTREKMLAEENARTRYEHHIHRLEEELLKGEDDLREEREAHARDRRALEHLRLHFSALPLSHVLPPTVVDRDQLSDIDYVSL